MNIISQRMVQEIAVHASDHVLLLMDSFESFFKLQQSSHIVTQHPIVGFTKTNQVGGFINIGALYYNIGYSILAQNIIMYSIFTFAGLFSIPIFLYLLYVIYAYATYRNLFTFDAYYNWILSWTVVSTSGIFLPLMPIICICSLFTGPANFASDVFYIFILGFF